MTKTYEYWLFEDLCKYYETSSHFLTLAEIWDEIYSDYENQSLADDVVSQLEADGYKCCFASFTSIMRWEEGR